MNDVFPQTICSECVKKVREAFNFKKMCECNDEKLRSNLSDESKTDRCSLSSEHEHDSLIVPEIVHIVDSFVNGELFDENQDVDDVLETEEPYISKENYSYEISRNEIESKISNNQTDEDYQLVNRAKRINGRYQCEICDKTLADRRTFLLHTRLHLGKKLKHCDTCGKGFARKTHLDRHKLIHSTNKSERKCSSSNNTKESSKMSESSKEQRIKVYVVKSEEEIDKSIHNSFDECDRNLNENSRNSPFNHINENLENMDEKSFGTSIKTVNTDNTRNNNEDEQHLIDTAKKVNGRLQCPICPRTLSHRKILRLHIRSHLGKNLLHCKICNRGFAKGSNLNRHMLLHCKIDSKEENQILSAATQNNGCFSCPYCAKTLIDRQTFRLHIRLHISKGLVRCDICNRGFEDDDELQKHMSCHGNQFSCSYCDQIFNSYHLRKDHINNNHGNQNKNANKTDERNTSIQFFYRDEKYDENDDEDKNIVKKSNCINGRFECAFCKKTLANRTTLKYHIRLHLGKHLLKCEICNQGFSKKSHLKRHFATHSKKKPCRYCYEVFETYEERKTHTTSVHRDVAQNHNYKTIIPAWTEPNGRKHAVCLPCNTSFNKIFELNSHLNWHLENPKSFDGIDFNKNEDILTKLGILCNENNLGELIHEKIKRSTEDLSKIYYVTNENGWEMSLSDSDTDLETIDEIPQKAKYECSKCEQQFNRLYKIMCHMKVYHDDIKFQEFKCSYCMQSFPSSVILAKHLRQQCESNSKQFVCPMCNNRFMWKCNLDKHVIIYHNADSKYINQNIVKLFKCGKCNKSFHRVEQLDTHKLTHTPTPRPKKFSCEICKKRFSRADNLK